MNKILKLLVMFSLIALPLSGCIDKVTMDQNGTVTIDPAKTTTSDVNIQTENKGADTVLVNNTSNSQHVVSNTTEGAGNSINNSTANAIKESEAEEVDVNTGEEEVIPENVTPTDKIIEEATEEAENNAEIVDVEENKEDNSTN